MQNLKGDLTYRKLSGIKLKCAVLCPFTETITVDLDHIELIFLGLYRSSVRQLMKIGDAFMLLQQKM